MRVQLNLGHQWHGPAGPILSRMQMSIINGKGRQQMLSALDPPCTQRLIVTGHVHRDHSGRLAPSDPVRASVRQNHEAHRHS